MRVINLKTKRIKFETKSPTRYFWKRKKEVSQLKLADNAWEMTLDKMCGCRAPKLVVKRQSCEGIEQQKKEKISEKVETAKKKKNRINSATDGQKWHEQSNHKLKHKKHFIRPDRKATAAAAALATL